MAQAHRRLSGNKHVSRSWSVSALCIEEKKSSTLSKSSKKIERLPFSPRTYERCKEKITRTEDEIDSAFRAIADKNRLDRAQSVSKLPEQPTLRALVSTSDDDVHCPARPTAQQRLQMKIEAARMEAASGQPRTPAAGEPKVPLTRTKDGQELVDVASLVRSSQKHPISLPLSRQEVNRVMQQKETTQRCCKSAPNFVLRNRSSSSLRSTHPEARQRRFVEQMRRRYRRADSAMERRRTEVEALRQHAFCDAQRRMQAASSDLTRAFSAPTLSKQTTLKLTAEPLQNANHVSYSEKTLKLAFQWAASEAFLSSVRRTLVAVKRRNLDIARRHKAQASWDEVVRFLRALQALKRWRRKFHAMERVKLVLQQVPVAYRLRHLHRQRKAAASLLQKKFRRHRSRLDSLVCMLIDGPWQVQENLLLEHIFCTFTTEEEVAVESTDLLIGIEDVEVESPPAATRTQSSQVSPRKSQAVANNATQKTGTSPKKTTMSAVAKRKQAQAADLQELIDAAMQKRVQLRISAHRFRRDVVQKLLLREVVERLYDRRAEAEDAAKAMDSSVLLAATAGEREFLNFFKAASAPESSKARNAQDCDEDVENTQAGHIGSSFMKTAVAAGAFISATRFTDSDIRELVFCTHRAVGVRPSHPEHCNQLFQGCPSWRIHAISEILVGSRPLRASLLDRRRLWASFQGRLSTSGLAFPAVPVMHGPSVPDLTPSPAPALLAAKSNISDRAVRPCSAPVRRLDVAFKEEPTKNEVNECSTTAFQNASCFEECFDDAEAFCRNVLAAGTHPTGKPTSADALTDASEDHMLPPGLTKLKVGDVPGLHAAQTDMFFERPVAVSPSVAEKKRKNSKGKAKERSMWR